MAIACFAALTAVSATMISSPDYRPFLRHSLISAIVALVCEYFAFRAGGWPRAEAIPMALAACYALIDFALRRPAAFP